MEHTCIIAEAGVNYNGDIVLAREMVAAAAEAGADVVKFQTGIPEAVISRFARKAAYQIVTTGNDENQLDMARKLMLPWSVYPELIECCNAHGIAFLSTPFDIPSTDFLHELQMTRWKIPSGEITNLPYLIHIAKLRRPVILSTGMSELEEIRAAVAVLQENGAESITLLQCNTEYPTPYADANLRAMETLREAFGLPVGFSDHTMGIEVPIAAAALGAVIIEKHFTLDRNMPGPDQKASVEPQELCAMVRAIRNVELALGTGIKTPSASERQNTNIARKSIVASRAIHAGELFSEENITAKRPGGGVSPMRWFEVLGKAAARDFAEDEMIECAEEAGRHDE